MSLYWFFAHLRGHTYARQFAQRHGRQSRVVEPKYDTRARGCGGGTSNSVYVGALEQLARRGQYSARNHGRLNDEPSGLAAHNDNAFNCSPCCTLHNEVRAATHAKRVGLFVWCGETVDLSSEAACCVHGGL